MLVVLREKKNTNSPILLWLKKGENSGKRWWYASSEVSFLDGL